MPICALQIHLNWPESENIKDKVTKCEDDIQVVTKYSTFRGRPVYVLVGVAIS